MSDQHPLLQQYLVEQLPDEFTVLTACVEWEQQADRKDEPLSDTEASLVAYMVSSTCHNQVLLEHALPLLAKHSSWQWLSWVLFHKELSSPGNREGYREFLQQLDGPIDWKNRLFDPQADGACPWDLILIGAQNMAVIEHEEKATNQVRLAILAEEIRGLEQSFLDQEHPLVPELSRKDFWLWTWCAIPMSSERLPILTHLLARGANPNAAPAMRQGPMSAISALLWATSEAPNLPLPTGLALLEKGWNHHTETVASLAPKWLRKKENCESTEAVSTNVLKSAMELLTQGGLDPSKSEEPSEWGSPLLGVISRMDQEYNSWEPDTIERHWKTLTSSGLAWHHPQIPSRNLISLLTQQRLAGRSPPTPFFGLRHWTLPRNVWQLPEASHCAEDFLCSHRGACLLMAEPRLLSYLLARIDQLARSHAMAPSFWKTPAVHVHPLTPLGQLAEQAIERADSRALFATMKQVVSAIADASNKGLRWGYVLPDSPESARLQLLIAKSDAGQKTSQSLLNELGECIHAFIQNNPKEHKRQIPKEEPKLNADGYTPAEAKALEDAKKGNEKARPLTLIYTEKNAVKFETWAKSRRADNESLNAWSDRIVKRYNPRDPASTYVLPSAARHLSLAAPALAAVGKLRDAFPHFEEVIGLIERHLRLETRGKGMFSLPPLLMAGPPGTGKTFFFQELASFVDTSYTMLSMEGITGGFPIVGLDHGWGNSNPGIVFDTLMAEGNTANPILLLDEIDKAPTDERFPVTPVLLPLLEPHSAAHFADRSIPLSLNASHICWVATANDLSKVDKPLLSRFTVMHVPNPDYKARCAMAQHIYRSLRNRHSWGTSFDEILPQETLQALAKPTGAARDLRKNLTEAFAKAATTSRTRLEPQDLPPPPSSTFTAPWDLPRPERALQSKTIGLEVRP